MNRAARLRLSLLGLALVGSLSSMLWSVVDFISCRRSLHRAEGREGQRLHATLPTEIHGGAEAAVAQAAQRAVIRRVVSVTSGDRQAAGKSIEWESSWPGALLFVDALGKSRALGGLSRLQLSAGESDAAVLRGRASFSYQVFPSTMNVAWAPSTHDVFRPPWKGAAPSAVATRMNRRQEEQRRREAEKAEADRKSEAEAQALEAKKADLKTRFSLTGIANNGRENIAFVDAAGATRQTMMVKSGDQIEDTRVESINEKTGEVKLDYQGRFSIVLKL